MDNIEDLKKVVIEASSRIKKATDDYHKEVSILMEKFFDVTREDQNIIDSLLGKYEIKALNMRAPSSVFKHRIAGIEADGSGISITTPMESESYTISWEEILSPCEVCGSITDKHYDEDCFK
jgi:hypothetical protein